MMSRNYILILPTVFWIIFSNKLAAQNNLSPREKIQAQKVAFITGKISLTPEEAQYFWPVYNEYEKKKEELINKQRNATRQAMEGIDALPDREIENLLTDFIEVQKAQSALLEDYNRKFLQILSAEKVMKLYIAEIQFKNFLLRQIKENRVQNTPRRK